MGEVVSIDVARQRRQARLVSDPGQILLTERNRRFGAPAGSAHSGGLADLIAREEFRHADHRFEARQDMTCFPLPVVAEMNGEAVEVLDLSCGGMRISRIPSGSIGRSVIVRLEGGPPQQARLVWARNGQAGLAF